MTPEEIKDRLGIPDASITLSDNEAFYWVNVSREHEGQRFSHNWRVPLHPSEGKISDTIEAIASWWADNTSENTA